MRLKVATNWYESLKCSNGVSLIREAYVHPDLRCNIWHVTGRDRNVIVDSGLGVASLRDYLSHTTEKETLAVASHTHFDHVGCHHEFAHRLCHSLEAEVLLAPNATNTVWSEYSTGEEQNSRITALPYEGFNFDHYEITPAPPSQLIEADHSNRSMAPAAIQFLLKV